MNKFLIYFLRFFFLMLLGLIIYFTISTIVNRFNIVINTYTKSEIGKFISSSKD